ncbi:MAG: DUF4105 domain-containing protein [Terriglobales bacterium]|jgi:hypothetical protein
MKMIDHASGWQRCLRWLAAGIVWLLLTGLTLWATSALYFDLSWPRFHLLTPVLYLIAILVMAYRAKAAWLKMAVCLGGFLVVLACWLSLQPSNDRNWQTSDSQAPWAEVNGDRVTIHNFRDCSYRTEFDYTCDWLTKTVYLSQLRGIDLFITYWGSPWIAHPILSFQFGDNDHVAASIEARFEVGQNYSAIGGFFRQFALLYIFTDEHDIIRLRTNYRKDEDVYLFHLNVTPDQARRLFMQYLDRANLLHDHPVWYNAVTDNCTTNIYVQAAAAGEFSFGRLIHDWWILLNGKVPEVLYRRGRLAGGLPFPELKKRAYINPVARTLNEDADYSRRIRENRPGFEFLNRH